MAPSHSATRFSISGARLNVTATGELHRREGCHAPRGMCMDAGYGIAIALKGN